MKRLDLRLNMDVRYLRILDNCASQYNLTRRMALEKILVEWLEWEKLTGGIR